MFSVLWLCQIFHGDTVILASFTIYYSVIYIHFDADRRERYLSAFGSKNICSCPGVKASLLMTDEATVVVLINSNSTEVEGTVSLDGTYRSLSCDFGSERITLDGDTLHVCIPARESAVVRLEK